MCGLSRPTFQQPNWQPGDTIPLGRDRTLRVVEVRQDEPDANPVLVVEDTD